LARSRPNRLQQPLTTAQRLGSLVKSARDIMRKDKGLNGDLDRLPMLTWIMFLKFLDDHEQVREERAKMKRQKYRSAIERRTAGATGRRIRRASRASSFLRSSTSKYLSEGMARKARGCSLTYAISPALTGTTGAT